MKHLMTYYLKVSSAWRRKFAYTAEEKTSWKCSMDHSIVKLMFSDYIDSSRTWKGSSYLILQMKRFQFFLLIKCLISFFISSFIDSFIWLNLFSFIDPFMWFISQKNEVWDRITFSTQDFTVRKMRGMWLKKYQNVKYGVYFEEGTSEIKIDTSRN